ncbi:hypothetical protein CDA63_01285 [Hymenobacter amundsenii]|uniref:TonB-dependent receptor plug domain-containing protein n=1 Tax=Hymenobacter amundsenii TaxID=2006685 RepID=A0A246FQM3_9BACT|nr:TonB-dependent receptor plug domain-containing protein [Hymenobacter amundsenii]OWP65020.1 hypothetical protein CDA63_01285 [Hymenobacter amundsenii]
MIIRQKALSSVAALALVGATAFGFAGPPDPAFLVQRLLAFYQTQPEATYLHLDQAAYAAGETLWFKAYVVDARAHRPDSLSRVLYVDVVTPERRVIFQRTLALEQGMAVGDIILPDTLSTGVYTLRAYTSWMRNGDEGLFFTRRVPVWQLAVPASGGGEPSGARRAQLARQAARKLADALKPEVQFFPEGGDYVAGLPTVVGVKAAAANGRGLALAGVITDNKKQEVARFATPALGMSSFNFTPQAGQQYRATVSLPDGTTATYELPAAQATGWLLNVREIGNEFRVFVRYQGTAPGAASPEPLQLLAHVRGEPVYVGGGEVKPGETFSAVIPKSKLPAGMLHITLFDKAQVAQAERLVFVPESQGLQVRLYADKPTYGLREKVTLDVEVTTAAGQPVPAELSLAISGLPTLPADAGDATDVRAHLLLTSELRGYVENPAFYLKERTPASRQALDNLLLTQGWSRFTWQQVLAPGSPTVNYLFPFERAPTLGGQILRGNGKPMAQGKISMLVGQQNDLVVSEANEEGRFLFTGFTGPDTTTVILQGLTDKGSNNVLLQLSEIWPNPGAGWRPVGPLSPVLRESAALTAYGQRSRRQQVLEREYRPDSTSGIMLRNVTIKGRKPIDNSTLSVHSTASASAVLYARDYPNLETYQDIFQMIQSRVPGMNVRPSGSSYSVLVRGISSMSGPNEPLFLLDGLPLADSEVLMTILPTSVDRIEILKGGAAAIYGSQGAGGVIAVYTKRGMGDYSGVLAPGVAVRRMPAYYRAREFYAPRYDTRRQSDKPDPRATTLYWQPRLSVPASGRTRLTFYTADQAGTFRAAVEGISLAGQPATAETTLAVQAQP